MQFCLTFAVTGNWFGSVSAEEEKQFSRVHISEGCGAKLKEKAFEILKDSSTFSLHKEASIQEPSRFFNSAFPQAGLLLDSSELKF